MLAVSNLSYVLLPAFDTIQHEPERARVSYLGASRLINGVGVPECALQAAVAGPLVRTFFAADGYDAIPILQILSIGWAGRIVAIASDAFLKSRGRFRLLFAFYVGYTLVYILAVGVGAKLGGAIGAAIAVSICLITSAPLQVWLSLGPDRGGIGDVFALYRAPALAAALAILPPYLLLDRQGIPDIAALVGTVLVSAPLYAIILRYLSPSTWADMKERCVEVSSRLRPRFVV